MALKENLGVLDPREEGLRKIYDYTAEGPTKNLRLLLGSVVVFDPEAPDKPEESKLVLTSEEKGSQEEDLENPPNYSFSFGQPIPNSLRGRLELRVSCRHDSMPKENGMYKETYGLLVAVATGYEALERVIALEESGRD